MAKSKKKYQKPYKEIMHPDERFTQISRGYMKGDAWLSLSPYARLLLIYMRTLWNKHNNGDINMSARFGATILKCAPSTAHRALKDLTAKGFIVARKNGTLGIVGNGVATAWELTDFPMGNKSPSQLYKRFKSKSQKQNPVPPAVHQNRDLSTPKAESVSDLNTGVRNLSTGRGVKEGQSVFNSRTYIQHTPHPTSLNINPNNLPSNFCDQNDHSDLASKLGSNGWELLLSLSDDQVNTLVAQNNAGELTKRVIENIHSLNLEKGTVQ